MAKQATIFIYRLGDETAGIAIRKGHGSKPIPPCRAAHDLVIAIPVIEPGQPAPMAGVEEIRRPVVAEWLADLIADPVGPRVSGASAHV